jgi:hypothetical protein
MLTDDHTLGSGPIEERHRAMMRGLATVLDQIFNGDDLGAAKKTGFVVMVFPFNNNSGRCNYISNADRADVVTLLREQLAYFEGQPDDLRGHA